MGVDFNLVRGAVAVAELEAAASAGRRGTWGAKWEGMQALREWARARTALIAEDDEGLSELVEEALAEAGFATRRVADGVAAINEILETKPDVVVLDLVLPRLRGQDVCSMVRKSPTVNQTAIVVISGTVQQDDRTDVFRLGADDFVAKPFRADELVARVQAVCHRTRHRQRFSE